MKAVSSILLLALFSVAVRGKKTLGRSAFLTPSAGVPPICRTPLPSSSCRRSPQATHTHEGRVRVRRRQQRQQQRQQHQQEAQQRSVGGLVLQGAQTLEFQEPRTNVTVKLVGSMHYNPASVRLVTETVTDLGREGRLGSVLIESCDMRWEGSSQMNPVWKSLLRSEMAAAFDAAASYNRPVVLGDQRINETVAAMKKGLVETSKDLVSPFNGGWERLYSTCREAWEEALPSSGDGQGDDDGDEYLALGAFFDPRLLLAAPVSLLKYPLSYLHRSPLFFLAFCTLLYVGDGGLTLSGGGAAAAAATTGETVSIPDSIASLLISVLETLIFVRVLIKELLAERNEVLARNILQQCEIYAAETTASGGGIGRLGSSTTNNNNNSNNNPFVPKNLLQGLTSSLRMPWDPQNENDSKSKSVATMAPLAFEGDMTVPTVDDGGKGGGAKTVVAVLGMAHCNGVMKLLKEQKVEIV